MKFFNPNIEKQMSIKRLVILCIALFMVAGTFAQSEPEPATQTTSGTNPQLIEKPVDSVSQTQTVAPEPRKKSWRRKLIWATDTLSTSDYMMSIERINEKLNDIRDSAKLSIEVVGMQRKINGFADDIKIIRQSIDDRHTRFHIKNLNLYHSFLSSLDDQNKQTQQNLNRLYNRLYHAKLRLKTAMSDSVFRALCADTMLRRTFDSKLERLQLKWARTDNLTRTGLRTLNNLKVDASDNSISISNMLYTLDNQLDKAGDQLLGQEVSSLWKSPISARIEKKGKSLILQTLDNERKAIMYYFSQTIWQRIVILLIALLLFGWLFMNRHLLKARKENSDKLAYLHLKYLNTNPVPALISVILLLTPFFDAYAPTSYLAIEFILLLVSVSIIFKQKWDRSLWNEWMALVGIFLIVVITNQLIEPTFFQRIWLVLVYVGIIVVVRRFIQKLDPQIPFYRWIKIASAISLVLAFLGIISNLFGRYSLACILGVTSVFAILQAVALPLLLDTILEILFLQIQSSRLRIGINRPFDHSVVAKRLRLPLCTIMAILWLVLLTSNLNIYSAISNSVESFFTTPRSVGSVSFKLISVVLFFAIIWFAHILQRLISFTFGETGNDTEDVSTVSKEQHSRLLVTRLLVLFGGYLLAIAASGLPIDKITIVIGALGVGIGLGLQNIVNNFVSGIILIFDGSLQIGDEIEVSGQSGKVKEIGLRASTLNTADGAEVIIPNGIILSQNIVNWTYSNDQRRVMIEFSLSGDELDTNVINEVINTTLAGLPNVILQKKPVILFTKVQQDTCWLNVHFWSTISKIDQVKSEARLQLNDAFASKGISMK